METAATAKEAIFNNKKLQLLTAMETAFTNKNYNFYQQKLQLVKITTCNILKQQHCIQLNKQLTAPRVKERLHLRWYLNTQGSTPEKVVQPTGHSGALYFWTNLSKFVKSPV